MPPNSNYLINPNPLHTCSLREFVELACVLPLGILDTSETRDSSCQNSLRLGGEEKFSCQVGISLGCLMFCGFFLVKFSPEAGKYSGKLVSCLSLRMLQGKEVRTYLEKYHWLDSCQTQLEGCSARRRNGCLLFRRHAIFFRSNEQVDFELSFHWLSLPANKSHIIFANLEKTKKKCPH